MAAHKGNKYAVGHSGGGGRPRNVDYTPFLHILESKIKFADIEVEERVVDVKYFEWVDKKNKKGKIIGKVQKPATKKEMQKNFKSIWDALAYNVLMNDKDMIKTVFNKFYPDVRQIEANVNEQLDKEDMKQYSNEELDTIISEGRTIQKSRTNEASKNGESGKGESKKTV